MNKKISRVSLFAFCAVLLSVFFSNTVLSTPASAFTAKSGSKIKAVYQKAIVWGINQCYSNTYTKQEYVKPKNGDVHPFQTNIFTDAGKDNSKLLYLNVTSQNKGKTKSDNGFGRTTSCMNLFMHATDKYFGVASGSVGQAELPSVGYNIDTSKTKNWKRCITYTYKDGTTTNGAINTKTTAETCFNLDGNSNTSKVTGVDGTSIAMGDCKETQLGLDGKEQCKTYKADTQISASFAKVGSKYVLGLGFHGKAQIYESTNPITWDEVLRYATAIGNGGGQTVYGSPVNYTDVQLHATNATADFGEAVTYAKASNAASSGINYFTKGTYTSTKKFTNADILTLYQNYINQLMNANSGVGYRAETCKKGNTVTEIENIKKELIKETGYLYHKSTRTWCVMELGSHENDKFTGISEDKKNLKEVTFKDIVLEMQKKKYDKFKTPAVKSESAKVTTDEDEGSEISCYNAAASLGWFLCPLIQGLSSVTTGIYDSVIKDQFLAINGTTLMKNGGTLYDAWGDFRNYANIIFVILLTIVILSQLTGIGLSNYSIKKALPRLVLMVILVNVSFIICQLAVDLSNILGDGLQKLFEKFASQVRTDNSIDNIGDFIHAIAGTDNGALFGSVATTGIAIAGVAIAVNTWEIWIFPFLLFLLGCVIGILFCAIILGVRQAGIIILIALTPVAVICYALPNTKKLFDKWFKLFMSLLMVFPIAGALMGGGLWASNLMLGAGGKDGVGFFYALVAMLLQVVPFFFIPTLVKGSLAAAGQIGAKIAGFGDNLGRAAKGSIRNSDRYKDTQERLAGNRGQRMLNRDARLRKRDERSAEFRANHRILGALRHPGGTFRSTQMGQNGRNRRLNRANQAVLAASLNNRDRSDAFEQRQINEFADDFTSSFDKQGMLDNEVLMGNEAAAALKELEQDPNNLQAKGRYLAAARQLAKSGPERSRMQNVLDTHAYNNHGTVDTEGNTKISDGLRWADSAWKKEIAQKKDNALGVFNRAHEMSQGSININSFKEELDEKGDPTGMWINHAHDDKTVSDIGAGQIGKMDKPELKSYISALKNGTLKPENAKSLIAAAHEANNNPNISVDGDKQDLVDQIARFSYTNPEVGGNDTVSSVDSSTMNIMARSSQAELTRMANYAANGKTKGQELKQLANVAEATLRGANLGKVNLNAEKAEQLNRILAADKRKTIPYSLRVDHSNPAPPPPSGYHDTGTGSGIIIPD